MAAAVVEVDALHHVVGERVKIAVGYVKFDFALYVFNRFHFCTP